MLAGRGFASKAVVLDKLFKDKPVSLEVVPETTDDGPKKGGILVQIALKLGGFYRCVPVLVLVLGPVVLFVIPAPAPARGGNNARPR